MQYTYAYTGGGWEQTHSDGCAASPTFHHTITYPRAEKQQTADRGVIKQRNRIALRAVIGHKNEKLFISNATWYGRSDLVKSQNGNWCKYRKITSKSEIRRYLLRRGEKSVCRASECISVADYYKSETCKSRFLLKVTAEHLISDFKKIKGSLWRLGFVIKIDIMTRAKRACHSIGHYTNWWA